MVLIIKSVRKRLYKVGSVLLVFGDAQSEADDERVVETFGCSTRLWVVGLPDQILHLE